MSKDVIRGKGTSIDLESLHGAITKVYVSGVIAVLNDIKIRELAEDKYIDDLEKGIDEDDLHKPLNIGTLFDKDTMALLKQAQAFLKENDIQCDIVKTTGNRAIRGKIRDTLKDKRKELE